MKNQKKKVPKSLIIILVLSMVLTNLLVLQPHLLVSAASVKTAFKQTAPKELFVGDTYTLEIINKQAGASYQWSSSSISVATVNQNGLVKAIAAGTATITCKITKDKKTSTITAKIIVKKSSEKPISVDKNGFDSQGRIAANFGTPKIDGIVDEVWNHAPMVTPKYVSNNIDTSATFKALWDDNAMYILAEVKDKNLSVQSGTPYMQDSLEIFLDENNDKTKDYGPDDLHFRVNYENTQSVDVGNAERFYTSAKKMNSGYLIEARVALKAKPANGKIFGIELQINDAKGTDRVGTINVFDSTGSAWNDTTKFGNVFLTGRADNAISGLNPYDLLSLIQSTKKLDLTRYKNANTVTDAIKASQAIISDKNATQKQIDDQYAALKTAISNLVLSDEAANVKQFKAVPDEYRAESKKQGTIENLEYTVTNDDNSKNVKKLNVYLPYGYDASDASKKYNVLYLMHGGGEDENTIFGGPGQSKELKKILDNMIANGDIAPLIVVTPSFNTAKKDTNNDTAIFHKELINNVLPLVETKYHTYAASGDIKDLKASRDHRAFGGFSMGSVTTWYTFINCLDYFKYYMPISGDCWALGQTAGNAKAKETAEYLAKAAKEAGYTPKDYYLFCATGSQDIAYPNLKPQIDAMMQLKDSFIYSSDTKKGNFYFVVSPDGTHAWNWVDQYIYDILPDLFK